MAVTRADKEQELQELEAAFKAADTAILVDYKGLNVPAVTELRRQIRGAKAQYKVVKNTLARRASKGTRLASLEAHFEGTTAVAYTGEDAVALAKVGTVTVKQVEDIAKQKMPDLNCTDLAAAVKTVRGTARSMGIDVIG